MESLQSQWALLRRRYIISVMARKADILARRVNLYLKLQSALKPQYKRMDDLLAKILKDMKPNQVAGSGILVDNFAT